MAKRQSRKTGKAARQVAVADDKARRELRLDPDVDAGLVKLAAESGISVNQLVQGIARWAIRSGQSGEGVREESGNIVLRKQAGCVFFGEVAHACYASEEEVEAESPSGWTKGTLIFNLDLTERHVIRDEE